MILPEKRINVTFINKTIIVFLDWDDFLPQGPGGAGSQHTPIIGVHIKLLLLLD